MRKRLPKIKYLLFFRNLFILLLVITSAFSIYKPKISYADELSDLNKKIQQKEKEKSDTLKNISDIESKIKSLQQQKTDIDSKKKTLAELKIQKTNLDVQISNLDKENTDQELDLQTFSQKLKDNEKDIQDQSNYLYKLSFTSQLNILNEKAEIKDYFGKTAAANASLELLKKNVLDYKKRIDEIKEIKVKIAKDKESTSASKTDLEKQITSLQNEVNTYNNSLASANKSKTILESKKERLLADISEYQRQIIEAENKKMSSTNTDPSVNKAPVLPTPPGGAAGVPNAFYFSGRGRDLYQGHGVGLSQFGALGGAVKGMTAEQLLTFYYTSTSIVDLHTITPIDTIKVSGYGEMNINDYVSGLGEIPDNACEDLGVEFKMSNLWYCWPREAIKTQVIAARTYAMSYAKSGSTICTTAACQVYKGGSAKKWASDATLNKTVAYGGNFISAVYSSDNNQGYGTANNDTIWSSYNGVGTPYAYLRAKDDSSFAMKSSYTDWYWYTKAYTFTDVTNMLKFNANKCASRCVQDTLNSIGDVKDLKLTFDPSRRVKYITLVGTKGSENMAGWFFKAAWTDWTYSKCSNNQTSCDYIFSLTFNIVDN